jgi:hypothetical protein
MIGALNRMLSVADARLVRRSRLARLEAEVTAQRERIAQLESALGAVADRPAVCEPSETWRRELLAAISGIVESRLNDAQLIGYHEASRSTTAYILEHMRSARLFRSPFLTARGDTPARDALLRHALAQARLPGLFLEFGVFSGESINFIAQVIGPSTVYGFDSFEGLPEDWFFEMGRGCFDRKGQLPAVLPNVRLVPGWFHETLPPFLEAHAGPVAFAHVDCDLYSSAKVVLGLLREHIVPGTVLVFDEYFNYPGWQDGEFKAFREFVQEGGLVYEYLGYTTQWYSAAVRITAKRGG